MKATRSLLTRGAVVLGAALAAACGATQAFAAPVPLGANGKPIAMAGLEGCVTSVVQVQRSATFVGGMTAVPGTVRMQMRIEVLVRAPGEPRFRTISYPGLGQWLRSSPGTKTYRNFSKVTDLSAPAVYRAAVRYRWLGPKGRLIRTLELRTPRCQQPAPRRKATSPPQSPHSPARASA